MEDLTSRICWELVKKEGYIAIWRKPLNNGCYLNRDTGVQPPLCDSNDDPDNVWYALVTFNFFHVTIFIHQHHFCGLSWNR